MMVEVMGIYIKPLLALRQRKVLIFLKVHARNVLS